jgi:uncharacterized protein (TIGR03000 family)
VTYTIQVTVLPYKHTADDPNIAVVVAHVPEDADIWFEDAPTKQRGTLRYFESPPLTPGKNYTYTVRVRWYEDGQWVSQMHSFPAHAGDVHCIDVVPTQSAAVEERVKASLARLDPDDRKLAEEQRFCAAQEGIRLGAMGTPVKVALKGQPVFLCCKGCVEKAQANPDQTLAQVEKNKAKNKTSPVK